jgi:hypothetical protein
MCCDETNVADGLFWRPGNGVPKITDEVLNGCRQ